MKALLFSSCALATISVASFTFWIGQFLRTPQAQPAPQRLGVHVAEPEQRLGSVRLNEVIRGTFLIVNDSGHSVTLSEPFMSCACTDSKLDRRSLAPGERCNLSYTIDAGANRTPRSETISVRHTTADGKVAHLYVKVYFEPKGDFGIDPPAIVLTRAEPKACFTVQLLSTNLPYKVLNVRSNHRCVRVDTVALPRVALELDLSTPDESMLNAECVITTDHPSEGTIRVPVLVRKE